MQKDQVQNAGVGNWDQYVEFEEFDGGDGQMGVAGYVVVFFFFLAVLCVRVRGRSLWKNVSQISVGLFCLSRLVR